MATSSLAGRLEAIVESALKSHEQRENILRNYARAVREICAADGEALPRVTEKWLASVRDDKMTQLHYDFNNALLGRVKPFLQSPPWEADYASLYVRLGKWEPNADEAEPPNRETRLFGRTALSFEKFQAAPQLAHLLSAFDHRFRDNAFVEVRTTEENPVPCLFALAFARFVTSNAANPKVLTESLLDLLSLELLLVRKGQFSRREFRALNHFAAQLLQLAANGQPADLWREVDALALNLDIVWELAKLLNAVLSAALTHLDPAQLGAFALDGGATRVDARSEAIAWLRAPLVAPAPRVLVLLFNVLKCLLDLRATALLLFDGRQPLFVTRPGPADFAIVLNLAPGAAPLLVADQQSSKAIQSLFCSVRFEDFADPEGENFSEEDEDLTKSFEEALEAGAHPLRADLFAAPDALHNKAVVGIWAAWRRFYADKLAAVQSLR